MKKELQIRMVEDGEPQMVPIRSALPTSDFTFWFECVGTTGGFPFIFIPCWPPADDSPGADEPGDWAKAKLSLLVPVLNQALTEAAKRAQLRQREIEREKQMERLSHTLTAAGTMTDLLPLCWSFSI